MRCEIVVEVWWIAVGIIALPKDVFVSPGHSAATSSPSASRMSIPLGVVSTGAGLEAGVRDESRGGGGSESFGSVDVDILL